MKKLFFIPFLFLAQAQASVTINGQCYDLLWNPWTGTNQYVNCSLYEIAGGGTPGQCLMTNGLIPPTYSWGSCGGGSGGNFVLLEDGLPPPVVINYALLEDNTFILLEDGTNMLLEN